MQTIHKKAMLKILAIIAWSAWIVLTAGTAVFAAPAENGPGSYAELADQVKNSVVNVFATKIVDVADSLPFDSSDSQLKEFFERFFGDLPEGKRERDALGSGFIIDSSGLILTNSHVVEKSEQIKIRLHSQKEYIANIVGRDPETDVALIKVEPDESFPNPAKLGNSDMIQVGDGVMAAGNPFGLSHSVTVGIISAKGRFIGAGPYDDFLQTDAAINPGNSGGPLFNMNGEVIGVNTAMVAGGQGIGFAIPINTVRNLLPMLKEGEIVRGWLGVVIQKLTPELAGHFKLDEPKGVLIADLIKGGPAEKAGLLRGDIVVNLADRPINDPQEITNQVASIEPGTRTRIQFMRDGLSRSRNVTVGTMPKEETEELPSPAQPSEIGPHKWGVALDTLTPELARRLGLENHERGVVISQVIPMSPAARAGLQPGDVIQEVNRQQVEDIDQLQRALGQAIKDKKMLVLVRRGENTFFMVLQG